MVRTNAVIRPTKSEGLRVYDIFHVWPDRHVENGVVHRSWLFVYLATPPADDGKVQVVLQLPNGEEQRRDLAWRQEWYSDVPAWGVYSVTAVGDHPLEFFWELTPGKA